MVNIDLITGFLGAGKTTFIKKYAEYLRFKGESFAVIENEYGTKGIDSRILAAEGIHADELFGGCICCTLKVGFHDMLLELSDHFDRIIVEPSGVYDISQFYSVISSSEMKGKCQIGGIICVVDPFSVSKLDDFSREMLKDQIMASGSVIFSMDDDAGEVTVKNYRDLVCNQLGIGEFNISVYDDFQYLSRCGSSNYIPDAEQTHSARYLSTTIKLEPCSADEIKCRIDRLYNNGECGTVLRIKGVWGGYMINSVSSHLNMVQCDDEEGLNIIGLDLNRKKIREILKGNI